MAVHRWIYHGQIKKHLIELNHDAGLRKLLIKLNGDKVIYEPEFTKDAESFFLIIDGELCTISVEKEAGAYKYNLEASQVNGKKKLPTPEKKEKNRLYVAFASITAGFVLLILFVFFIFPDPERVSGAWSKPLATTGTVFYSGQENFNSSEVTEIAYHVQGKRYLLKLHLKDRFNQKKLAPNGMPLKIGDEFVLVYDRDNPEKSIIDFHRPAPPVMSRYMEKAFDKLWYALKNFKDLKVTDTDLTNYCKCLLDKVADEYGVGGLAQFYFLDVTFEQNPHHNTDTYNSFVNSNNFAFTELSCRNKHLRELREE